MRPKSLGFTGFELLIVVGLVGLLAWLVISRFSGLSTDARDTERRLDTSIIAAELEAFHTIGGHYPASTTLLPSYAQYLTQGAPAPDTVAFLDPSGNFILDAPTASANAPATGYDPAEIPEGSQYTYAPYGCVAAANVPEEDAGPADETEAETTGEDETVDDTAAENFDTCQSYVIYAWMENDLVYSKVSVN